MLAFFPSALAFFKTGYSCFLMFMISSRICSESFNFLALAKLLYCSNSQCRRVATIKRRKFGNNTPSVRAFGMFAWAHLVVRNNFQKRSSNMLAAKNALFLTLGKNACKIANMRYAYPAVIQVKLSNIGCSDEVVRFILSKWRPLLLTQ